MGFRAPIDPDEIFLDSSNLPSFDLQQFEGQIERPISKKIIYLLCAALGVVAVVLVGRLYDLQINRGEALAVRSENNILRHTPIFPERGVIYDRDGQELVWNNVSRRYLPKPGLGHLLGYIGYPSEREVAELNYHPKELVGRSGVESGFNEILRGQLGVQIEEVDVLGELKSSYLLSTPEAGENVLLTIDTDLQNKFYEIVGQVVESSNYAGGAGVLMAVDSGELLAMVSYPEYDPSLLASGANLEQLVSYQNDPRKPFLNRALAGLYSPGSTIKTIIGLAGLNEGVITPSQKIYSSGELRLPNPYAPEEYTVFRDWKAHGWVDMRQALAVSSDVYFYQVGGGFEDQRGIGITKIEEYARLFGYGSASPLGQYLPESGGVIPNPAWKAANFDGDAWRVGNTYHTSIGQYGFQVTPLQVARASAALASGRLPTPRIAQNQKVEPPVDLTQKISPQHFQVIREGMRQAVTAGTAASLNLPFVAVAAKSGTAEVGVGNQQINAWISGYFPYQNPRYAFAVVLEKGPRGATIGGGNVMNQLFHWLQTARPEMLK